jgi:hypothetical protein
VERGKIERTGEIFVGRFEDGGTKLKNESLSGGYPIQK